MFSPRNMRKLGWLFFGLMWIPFTGIFVGMMEMPDGNYGWMELPELARYSIIATGVSMALALVLLFGAMLLSGVQNRSLLRNGQTAQATILSIEHTGSTVNNYNYGLSFLLDVQPLNELPFQARAEKFVPIHGMNQYQVGMQITVRFDPRTQRVAIP